MCYVTTAGSFDFLPVLFALIWQLELTAGSEQKEPAGSLKNWQEVKRIGRLLHFKDRSFCPFRAPDRTVQSGNSLKNLKDSVASVSSDVAAFLIVSSHIKQLQTVVVVAL